MISKNTLFVLSLLMFSGIALAETHGGGHGAAHDEGLSREQLKTIIYQAINVSAIVVGLIYFLKASARQFFSAKKAAYVSAAEKTQSARKNAEEEHQQIKVQLNKLVSTADESLSRAKAEAADMKTQMIAEAQAMSKRIREEAALTVKFEVEKAKTQLRDQLMKESFAIAEAQMTSKVSNEDHARLQGEFINNIQAVQR